MQIPGNRRELILRLVRNSVFRTQKDLCRALRAKGIKVNQATVSRDIRSLGLITVPDPAGGRRYAVATPVEPEGGVSKSLILRRFVRQMSASGNLAVIRTDPGTAPMVGEAIDRLGIPGVLGTVAGDNTLFVALDRRRGRRSPLARIRATLGGRPEKRRKK